jgi:hypothetical protein
MFGLFGKKSSEVVDPSVDWNPKTRVLTLVDRSGYRTVRKDPSSMFPSTHEVVRMEIVRDEVRFTLTPKDKREKSKLTTYSLRGKIMGCKNL